MDVGLLANDAPVGVADSYDVAHTETLTVNSADGVLDNDTDTESDTLSAELVDDVSRGALTLNANGSFTYVPEDGFSGSVTFSYRPADAHGTGTVQNDRAEALALAKLFDPGEVLVSATKSLIGHTMAAAGALEAIATVLALVHELVPPTANLHTPDPAIPFDCVPLAARRAPLTHAMSNSFGFGGQNAALIFRRAV